MTETLLKTGAIAFSAAALAACATPTYSARAGYNAPPPVAPQYPASKPAPNQGAAAAPVPASGTVAPSPAAAGTPAPAPVESQPLPPPDSAAPPPAASVNRTEPAQRPTPARFAATGKVVEPHGMYRDYVVRRKDTLDDIAHDLDTTREVLIEANHLKKPYELTPGRHLKVPIAKAYVAESGDTLPEVSRRFDVSAGELSDLNNLPVHGRLAAGEKVALPSRYHDQGPVRLPSETFVATPRPNRSSYAASSYGVIPHSTAAAAATGGPYVASPSAVAAGERAREFAAAQAATPQPAPGAYRPAAPETQAAKVDVAAAGKGRFIWPVRGEIISSFGAMGVGRRNDGIDIKSAQGTAVKAAAAGEVVYAGDQVPGFGNLVLVKHPEGWVTAYAHLDRVSVQMRQSVSQGQEIGQVGITGGAPAPELHFEIRYAPSVTEKAKPIDPLLVLPG